MPDILEFGLMDVIEEEEGVTFSVLDGEDIFCDRGEVRQLFVFLSGLIQDWDREWN